MPQNMKRGGKPADKNPKPSPKAQPTGVGQLKGNPNAEPSKSGANVKPQSGSAPKGR